MIAAAVCSGSARADVISVYERIAQFDIYATSGNSLPSVSQSGYSGPIVASNYASSFTLKTADAIGGANHPTVKTFSSGAVVIDPPNGSNTLSGNTLTFNVATGPGGGTFGYEQLLNPGSLGGSDNSSFLSQSGNTFTFLGGGTGGVENGGTYIATFVLHGGNYSGANAPSLSYVQAGPGFDQSSIVKNFVYDALSNTTTLEYEVTNYQGGGPRVQFTLPFTSTAAQVLYTNTLYVQAVPEPATWALFGCGFALLAAMSGLRGRLGRAERA